MARDRRPEALAIQNLHDMSLMDYVPAISPHLSAPKHLRRFVDLLEQAHRGRLRVCVAVPCQHGKTTLVTHAVSWWLMRHPRTPIIYATYGQQFSAKQSRDMRRIALESGVKLSIDHNTIAEWRTELGGGLLASSVDGGITGNPAQIVVVDDPFKDRQDAENAENREIVWQWYRSCVLTRLTPSASVFIVASRWHDDDLSGRLIRIGYQEVRLAAVNDDGEDPDRPIGGALCPWGPDPSEPRNEAFLRSKREEVGEYDWWSLFQGRPRPRSGSMFDETAGTYTSLPHDLRIVQGFDIAVSEGARSDYIAAVALGEHVETGSDGKPRRTFYVLDVYRTEDGIARAEVPLRAWAERYPGVERASYVSGPEKGILQLWAGDGFEISPMPARLSKFVRAKKVAAAWNNRRVLLPARAPWLADFKREVCNFTGGPGDMHDDQVDALVSAYDLLSNSISELPGGTFLHGRRCI